MNMIDHFEAAHMRDEQLIEECWVRDFTYHDYKVNCEFLDRSPVSKETFNALYRNYDTEAAQFAR